MMEMNLRGEAIDCSGCGTLNLTDAVVAEFKIHKVDVYQGSVKIRTDWNLVPTEVRCLNCDRKFREAKAAGHV